MNEPDIPPEAAEMLIDDWVASGRVVRRTEDADALPEPVFATDVEDGDPPGELVEDLLLDRELGFFFGDGGSMKTTIALLIAGAVAGRYPVLGREVNRSGPVLVVSQEDGADVLRDRLRAIAHGMGWDVERVVSRVAFLALVGVTLDEERWQRHMADWAEQHNAALVVFDPLAELSLARENVNDDQKPIIRYFRSLNRTVLVVDHPGKHTEGKRKKDLLRGASAKIHASRFCWYLEQKPNNRIGLECLKMSRMETPDPVLVEYTVHADPVNRTSWTSARFDAVDRAQATLDDAYRAIAHTLTQSPGLNSTDLHDAVLAGPTDAVTYSTAHRRMRDRGEIAFEQAGRAKKWYLTEKGQERYENTSETLPSTPRAGRAGKPCPPCPTPEGSPAKQGPDACPLSLERQAGRVNGNPTGQRAGYAPRPGGKAPRSRPSAEGELMMGLARSGFGNPAAGPYRGQARTACRQSHRRASPRPPYRVPPNRTTRRLGSSTPPRSASRASGRTRPPEPSDCPWRTWSFQRLSDGSRFCRVATIGRPKRELQGERCGPIRQPASAPSAC